jgi:hypothetical protein
MHLAVAGAVVPAVLALAGVLLAPIIGAIANLLSRPRLLRRQQELEYKKASTGSNRKGADRWKIRQQHTGRSGRHIRYAD